MEAHGIKLSLCRKMDAAFTSGFRVPQIAVRTQGLVIAL
jgi:hypothetical protein